MNFGYCQVFGDDLAATKKCKDLYDNMVRSLFQASKKSKNELVKETTKLKNKLDAAEKKAQKIEAQRERKRLAEIALGEEEIDEGEGGDDPAVSSWPIFKSYLQNQNCSNVAVWSQDSESHPSHHKTCILIDDAEKELPQAMKELVKSTKEKLSENPDALESSASLRKMQQKLDFPDWEESVSSFAAECLKDFTWAFSGYMKQPAHRTKGLDSLLDVFKETCSVWPFRCKVQQQF